MGESEGFFLSSLIAAAGALGLAAFGVVDTFKYVSIGTIRPLGGAGYRHVDRAVQPVMEILRTAYGAAGAQTLLREAYAGKGGEDVIRRTVATGLRTGLVTMNTDELARWLNDRTEDPDFPDLLRGADPGEVAADLSARASDEDALERLEDERDDLEDGEDDRVKALDERIQALAARRDQADLALTRMEMAVQARLDAGLTAARRAYQNRARFVAALVAVTVGVVVSCHHPGWEAQEMRIRRENGWGPDVFERFKFWAGVFVGALAVPIAPVAKDLAQAVSKAGAAITSLQRRS